MRAPGDRGVGNRGGTQTVTELGQTLMRSFRLAGRAPPSSSKRTFWSNRMLNFLPLVTFAKGERSGCPSAIRPNVRAHCTGVLAVTTPSSRRPSSGCACGNALTPPRISPTFAASTHATLPVKNSSPSTLILARTRRAPRFLIPVTT